jgi:hypothetical protein
MPCVIVAATPRRAVSGIRTREHGGREPPFGRQGAPAADDAESGGRHPACNRTGGQP